MLRHECWPHCIICFRRCTTPHPRRDWVLGAAASHPMLHQANWDPWRRQAELIEQVKAFLEAAARVDLSSPYNDIARFPASSYPPSQRHLARLEALTGACGKGGGGSSRVCGA